MLLQFTKLFGCRKRMLSIYYVLIRFLDFVIIKFTGIYKKVVNSLMLCEVVRVDKFLESRSFTWSSFGILQCCS